VAKKSGIGRALKITGILLLCLLMLSGASIYFLPHFGWRVDDLRSGSMEPQLMVGDLIFTRPVVTSKIAIGDIIMFHSPPGTAVSIISHRVVGIRENSLLSFQTKGDGNAAADSFTVPARDVVGQFASRIPHFGFIVIFLKTLPGLLVSMIAPGLVIIWLCLKNIRDELAQNSRGKPVVEVE
jgi:signal peptidase I